VIIFLEIIDFFEVLEFFSRKVRESWEELLEEKLHHIKEFGSLNNSYSENIVHFW